MRQLVCFLIVLCLGGCSQEDLLQKFASPEAQATAKGYIDRLRSHDFDAIENASDQSIKGQTLRATLEQMAGLVPAQEPTSVKLVGAQSFHMSGATTVSITFEYNFGDKWLLANVAVQDKGGVKTIIGFNVVPEAQSLEEQNRFTLFGKSTAQYLVLGAALAAALLTLCALVACVRTKLPGRKWPWVLFILVGFGKLAVNWTTGQWGFAPVSVQVFSASAFAPLYGPWTVSVSIPIGAAFFLIYRRRRLPGSAVNGRGDR